MSGERKLVMFGTDGPNRETVHMLDSFHGETVFHDIEPDDTDTIREALVGPEELTICVYCPIRDSLQLRSADIQVLLNMVTPSTEMLPSLRMLRNVHRIRETLGIQALIIFVALDRIDMPHVGREEVQAIKLLGADWVWPTASIRQDNFNQVTKLLRETVVKCERFQLA